MEARVSELFHRHPDAGIYLSQPGIGDITGARMLGEFGDAPGRYASAKARKNYAGTSPLTIQSGKKKTVHARYIRNRHLIDALHAQAFAALTASPGARACYDELRARQIGHEAALRRVAGRLTGVLHGCVTTGREYDEATAWSHRETPAQAVRADNLVHVMPPGGIRWSGHRPEPVFGRGTGRGRPARVAASAARRRAGSGEGGADCGGSRTGAGSAAGRSGSR
jgi:hypothetical protein